MRAIVVMGVSGCGKTTVAGLLADALGWDFLEGDRLHPPRNVELMSSGIPLTDDDRAPWLAEIATWMDERLADGRSVVVACSALARRYRDVLRRDDLTFVHLAGTRAQLAARLSERQGHFMKAGMLDSQLAVLEPPQADEDRLTVDVALSPADAVAGICGRLQLYPSRAA